MSSPMSEAALRDLIEHYARGGETLSLAVRGLTPEDMAARPPADAKIGLWSIQEVVVHLMDSDLIGADRMKRIIAEDNPTLIGYDENRFARHLFYEEQDAQVAVQVLDLNRRQFAIVLRKLPAAAFERVGQHNEVGQVKLGSQIRKYNEHLENHLAFIHKKRAWMGKEMW